MTKFDEGKDPVGDKPGGFNPYASISAEARNKHRELMVAELSNIRKLYNEAYHRSSSRLEIAVFAAAIAGLLIPLRQTDGRPDLSWMSILILSIVLLLNLITLLINKRYFRLASSDLNWIIAHRIDNESALIMSMTDSFNKSLRKNNTVSNMLDVVQIILLVAGYITLFISYLN